MNTHVTRIHRRTLLRGAGVAMALPWLESIPVWGGEAAAGSAHPAFPKRFAALFMGNGISPNHWWAKGAGRDMELSKTLGADGTVQVQAERHHRPVQQERHRRRHPSRARLAISSPGRRSRKAPS